MKHLLFFISAITITLNTFAQTEGLIDNTGSKLFYKTFGKGKAIVIINGGPGFNSNGFEFLATELGKDYQTIIYDQRGTGKSTINKVNSTTITVDLMVEDLETLRTHLKLEKWIVMGHSFGGMLASYYATKHPDRIEKLILSASGGIDLDLLGYFQSSLSSKLTSAEQDSLNFYTNKLSAGDTSILTRSKRTSFLASAYLYNKSFVPTVGKRMLQMNTDINNLVWQNMRSIKFDCAEKLKTFHKPTLIIQGKQDLIKEATGKKAQSLISNSKLVIMDKCGHYGWLDRPDIYFPEIRNFIDT